MLSDFIPSPPTGNEQPIAPSSTILIAALPPDMTPVGWSPDDDQVLLQLSPGTAVDRWSIWQLAADGHAPLAMVVDQALFLAFVPPRDR